ncbi:MULTISPECIES: hypothetical protein [unclassified Borrelia]|uniref:hypothetical protein n=1 Tax=unclassified Borrelia TaxID=2649934 RepID=UPI001E50180A|nr:MULTISPECIES: hypothetical protein [unclassified Borrelia]UGQ16596.1 hypothetical protein LSO06_04585 [Borrelia sp. RT5S]UGQ17733.1 hypothetical protein LSO05_04715 [Borrelia sp. RT1S]
MIDKLEAEIETVKSEFSNGRDIRRIFPDKKRLLRNLKGEAKYRGRLFLILNVEHVNEGIEEKLNPFEE